MARATVTSVFPGSIAEAESVWYDPVRWPAWVDGLHHVRSVGDAWPAVGARVVWDSGPGGRGRVGETVVAYEVRSGQTLEVEDAQMRGTQTVSFAARGSGQVAVTVELRWELKREGLQAPLTDWIFVRRAFMSSLRRTLQRFGRELAAERAGLAA